MNSKCTSSKYGSKGRKLPPLGNVVQDKESMVDKSQSSSSLFHNNLSSAFTNGLSQSRTPIVQKSASLSRANKFQQSSSVSSVKDASHSKRNFSKYTRGTPDGKDGPPQKQPKLGGARPPLRSSTNCHRSLLTSKFKSTDCHAAKTSHIVLGLAQRGDQLKSPPLVGLKRKASDSLIRPDPSSSGTCNPKSKIRKVPPPKVRKIMTSDLASTSKSSGLNRNMPSKASASRDTGISRKKLFCKQNLSIEDFHLGRPLGKGRFGSVFMAKEKKSGFLCAIKFLPKIEVSRKQLEKPTQREININSAAKNPNILQFYTSFSDDKYIYLVLEYASQGQLYSTLKEAGRFSEDTAAKYTAQVINALNHLHSSSVMHRDLKPENILLARDGRVLLADFGCAIQTKAKLSSVVGTLDYISPEQVQGLDYGHCADNWSLGILVYEFLVGHPPFNVTHDDTEFWQTSNRISKVDLKFPDHMSDLAVDFISKLLQKNQSERMSLDDAAKHQWLTSYTRNP